VLVRYEENAKTESYYTEKQMLAVDSNFCRYSIIPFWKATRRPVCKTKFGCADQGCGKKIFWR
jgi:hypothetical protein